MKILVDISKQRLQVGMKLAVWTGFNENSGSGHKFWKFLRPNAMNELMNLF